LPSEWFPAVIYLLIFASNIDWIHLNNPNFRHPSKRQKRLLTIEIFYIAVAHRGVHSQQWIVNMATWTNRDDRVTMTGAEPNGGTPFYPLHISRQYYCSAPRLYSITTIVQLSPLKTTMGAAISYTLVSY
jgi:hypothetical protein